MGDGLVAVGDDAINLCFKLRDARVKFIPRIAVEAFTAKQAGGITANPGEVVFVHCAATSDARRLLSTGPEVRGAAAAVLQSCAAPGGRLRERYGG
jgi:seryl-tRNA(Sec) selenium transferase